MDEEISFRNDSDSMRMVRRSNPAVWTSASDDPHIPTVGIMNEKNIKIMAETLTLI